MPSPLDFTDVLSGKQTPSSSPLNFDDVLGSSAPQNTNSPFTSTVTSTAAHMLNSVAGQPIEDIGQSYGLPAVEGLGAGVRQYAEQVQQDNPSSLGSLGDIVRHPYDATMTALGSVAPQIPASLASSYALGKAGASLPLPPQGKAIAGAVGAGLGLFAPNFLQEYTEMRGKQNESGTRDIGKAALTALPAAGLETAADYLTLGASKLMPKSILTKALTDNTLKDGASLLGHVAKQAAKGVAVEAPTEYAQTYLEQYGGNEDTSTQKAADERNVSAALGGIGGAAVRGGISAFDQRDKKPDTSLDLGGYTMDNPPPDTDPTQPIVDPQGNVKTHIPDTGTGAVDTTDIDANAGPLSKGLKAGSKVTTAADIAPEVQSQEATQPIQPDQNGQVETPYGTFSMDDAKKFAGIYVNQIERMKRNTQDGGVFSSGRPPLPLLSYAQIFGIDTNGKDAETLFQALKSAITPTTGQASDQKTNGNADPYPAATTQDAARTTAVPEQPTGRDTNGAGGRQPDGVFNGLYTEPRGDTAGDLPYSERSVLPPLANEQQDNDTSRPNDRAGQGVGVRNEGLPGTANTEAGAISPENGVISETNSVEVGQDQTPTPDAVQPKVQPGTAQQPEIIEHTTKKGRVLRGVVRKDLTKAQAQEIDQGTFYKNGGYFLRENRLAAWNQANQSKEATHEQISTPETAQAAAETGQEGQSVTPDNISQTPFAKNDKPLTVDDIVNKDFVANNREEGDIKIPDGAFDFLDEPVANGFTVVRDVYGERHRVRKADLDSDNTLLKTFDSNGKPIVRMHRENILQDQNAPTPAYAGLDVIGTKETEMKPNGLAFKTQGAAQTVLNKHHLQSTHDVIANPNGDGFVLKKKTDVPETNFGDIKTSTIDTAAHEAATSPQNDLPQPTPAQIDAGNYKKGHVNVQGLDITVENPKGSERKGTDPTGKKWSVTMNNHYGYIKRTKGADNEQVDVFLGDNPETENVHVINQKDPKTGRFDEHKVMIGFDTRDEARAAYLSNYSDNWQGLSSISTMTMGTFKNLLASGEFDKPIRTDHTRARNAEATTGESPAKKENKPYSNYDTAAKDYGYGVGTDGILTKGDKPLGIKLVVNKGRLRFENKETSALYASYPPSPDNIGKFLEKFYYATKQGQPSQATLEDMATDQETPDKTIENKPDIAEKYPIKNDNRVFEGVGVEDVYEAVSTSPVRTWRYKDKEFSGSHLLPEYPQFYDQGLVDSLPKNVVSFIQEKVREREAWYENKFGIFRNQDDPNAPKKPETKKQTQPEAPAEPQAATLPELEGYLKDAEAELDSQGMVKNARTVSIVKNLEREIAKIKYPLEAGVFPLHPDISESINRLVKHETMHEWQETQAKQSDTAGKVYKHLTNRGITDQYARDYTDKLIAAYLADYNNPLTPANNEKGGTNAPDYGKKQETVGGENGRERKESDTGEAGSASDTVGVSDQQQRSANPRPTQTGDSGLRPRPDAINPTGTGNSSGNGLSTTQQVVRQSSNDGNQRPVRGQTGRDTSVSGYADATNYDLRDKPNIALTPAKRRDINNLAEEILKKPIEDITEADKDVLRQYTGSGGLDVKASQDKGAGIFNQHYTDYTTIREIYRALDEANIKVGKALEPSVGSGNFIGMYPDADWTAVDIDKTNTEIVKRLYPNANVFHESFETFKGKNFDTIISNVPFASFSSLAREHAGTIKPAFKAIHNFFFAQSVDKLKPGGVMAFMTSTGTMDGISEAALLRRTLIKQMDVIGAFRLPMGTQKANASTEVMIDIIFLQKRPEGVISNIPEQNEAFTRITNKDGYPINEYFVNNPDSILGELSIDKNKTSMGKVGWIVTGDADYGKMKLDKQDYTSTKQAEQSEFSEPLDARAYADKHGLKFEPGHVDKPFFSDGIIYDKLVTYTNMEGQGAFGRKATGKNAEKLAALAVIQEQLTPESVHRYEERFGINPHKDKALALYAKENYADKQLKEYLALFDKDFNLSGIFTGQVRFDGSGKIEIDENSPLLDRAESLEDEDGILSADSPLLQGDEVQDLLDSGDYARLSGGKLQNARLYYAGNIYKKLDDAVKVRPAAQRDKQMAKLERIKPPLIPIKAISITGKESWLPASAIASIGKRENRDGTVILGENAIDDRHLLHLFTQYVNNLPLVKAGKDETAEEVADRLKEAQNQLHNEAIPLIKQKLVDDGLSDEVTEAYNRAKNFFAPPIFDGSSLRNLPKTFRGKPFSLMKHQLQGAERAIYNKKGVLAFAPGLGKTPTAIIVADQLLQKGVMKKPLFIVPANTIPQWEKTTRDLYPNANVFEFPKYTTGINKGKPKDWPALTAEDKEKMVYDLTNNRYDYTFISTNLAQKFTIPRPTLGRYADELVNSISSMEKDDEELTKSQIKAKEQRLAKIRMLRASMMATFGDDIGFDMGKLGFDAVFADEVQYYKNIGMQSEDARGGIGASVSITATYPVDREGKQDKTQDPVLVTLGSARSYDFRFKTRYISEKNNGNNVFLLTGTPTPNKPLELMTLLHHLDTHILDEYGIDNVEAFVSEFLEITAIEQQGVDGTSKMQPQLTSIKNIDALKKIISRYVDYVPPEAAKDLVRPKEINIKHTILRNTDAENIFADIQERLLEAIEDSKRKMQGEKIEDAETVIQMYTAGRDASVDVRLYSPTAKSKIVTPGTIIGEETRENYSKIAKTVALVAKQVEADPNSTQLIFLDRLKFPNGNGSTHEDIRAKVMKATGLNGKQVIFINGGAFVNPDTGNISNSAPKPEMLQRIMDYYNEGKIKVLVGNTSKLGVGVDLQVNTTDIYQIDIPYRPDEIEQRTNRGVRQGNRYPEVRVHTFNQPGTFDALSYRIIAGKQGFNDVYWKDQASDTADVKPEEAPNAYDAAIELEQDPLKRRKLEIERDLSQAAAKSNALEKAISNLAKRIRSATKNREEFQTANNGIDTRPAPKYEDQDEKQRAKSLSDFKARMREQKAKNTKRIDELSKDLIQLEADKSARQSELEEHKATIAQMRERYVVNGVVVVNSLFSKNRTKTSGSTVASLRKQLPAWASKLEQSGKLVIEQSHPEEGVEGYFKGGKIHLVADNIDAASLQSVLRHEAWHYAIATDPKTQEAYKRFNQVLGKRFELAAEGKASKIENTAYQRVLAAQSALEDHQQEFESYLISEWQKQPDSLLGGIKRAIENFIAAIRASLMRIGFTFKDITPADLSALARYGAKSSRLNLNSGNPGNIAGNYRTGNRAMASAKAQRFYSALNRAFINAPDKVFGNGKQLALWLQGNASKMGVKADEIYFSGITDWLNMQGKVSRDDVLGYLKSGGVQVEDVRLGQNNPGEHDLPDGWYTETVDDDNGFSESWVVKDELGDIRGEGETEIEAIESSGTFTNESAYFEGETKYAQYTVPGGKNYQELLLTLPVNATKKKQYEQGLIDKSEYLSGQYTSSHFPDNQNIVAHTRFDERIDANGDKVLFINEIQSDWGQEGKKKGFKNKFPQEVFDAAVLGGMTEKQAREDINHLLVEPLDTYGRPTSEQWRRLSEATSHESSLDLNEIFHDQRDDLIKPAPFVQDTKAWVALAIKKLISHAVDNNIDKIAFINGEQAADLYDLRKHIESIEYEPIEGTGGLYEVNATSVNGNNVFNEDEIDLKRIEEVFGKEIAKKIEAGEGEKTGGAYRDWKKLSGLDLKQGGEGMKAFYDQIVPSVAREIAKRMGGEVGTVDISAKQKNMVQSKGKSLPVKTIPQYALLITPAMKAKVELEGMPLFSKKTDKAIGRSAGGTEPTTVEKASREEIGNSPTIIVDGVKRPTRNSNGQLIHQTEEGIRNFYAWFKDSKVVDDKGRPLVLEHGTSKEFDRFDPKKIGNIDAGYYGWGFYFTADTHLAGVYGNNKMPVYLSLQNPLVIKTSMSGHAMDELRKHVTDNKYPRMMTSELLEKGYDGVLVKRGQDSHLGKSGTVLEAVVIDDSWDVERTVYDPATNKASSTPNNPKQANANTKIKSTDNSGAFSPNTDNIKYSKAVPLPKNSPQWAKDFSQKVTEEIEDRFKTHKTFSLLNKTISTQAFKAKKDKDYKRVYDRTVAYEQSTAKFANETANLAPDLLPDTYNPKTVYKSTQDAEAVGKAIFDTTLRDKPMSLAELKTAGYTPSQIKMYNQFFAAVNKSLDDVATTEMGRMARAKGIPRASQGMGLMQTARYYAEIAMENEDPKLAKEFLNKAQAIQDLKDKGYAPLQRFGQYTVTIMEKGSKDPVYFGMYESETDANKDIRVLEQKYPEAAVIQGVMSQQDWTLFQGVTPETMEIFAKLMGIEEDKAFQDYLKLAVSNRSALKHLIHRKKTAGHSFDPQRVLATFITANARQAAKNVHMGDMLDAIANIPKEKGDVKDEAVALYNYVQNPTTAGAGIRNSLFAWYLGGSVAAAAVNLTQSFTTTYPALHTLGSAKDAARNLGLAMRLARKPELITNKALANALKLADEEGITAPHELHALYGESMRAGLFNHNKYFRPVMKLWGGMFALAEGYNRRVAFIAAYNMAKGSPSQKFAIAEQMVNDTQFNYNKSSRSNAARSPIGSAVFTFKTFLISYSEFILTLPRKERAIALAVLILLSGVSGAPGGDDLDDLIDTIGQSLGYATLSKSWKDKHINKYILYGLSSALPVDISSRLGVANLIPGTSVFKKSEIHKERDFLEFIGPSGSMVKNILEAWDSASGRIGVGSKISAATHALLPKAVSDLTKAYDMAEQGAYRDYRGRKVMDTDMVDAAAKAIGFQPSSVAELRKPEWNFIQLKDLTVSVESDIASLWAEGVYEKDKSKIDDARAMLVDWNSKNSTTPIRINPTQIARRVKEMGMTSRERLIKSTPREIRRLVP